MLHPAVYTTSKIQLYADDILLHKPIGRDCSQEWVKLVTCRVELCRMDFQHENAYAAVQSAVWLCNIYAVNVGCPGEVTGNINSQVSH